MLLKLSAQIKQTNQDWYDVSLDKVGFLIKVDHSWPPKKIEVEIPFRIAESNANLRRQEKAKKRFVECAKKRKKKELKRIAPSVL